MIEADLASALIKQLEWHENMIVTNDFGEVVWLGICRDTDGNRVGITDCCFVDEPCEHHAAISKSQPTGAA